MSSDEKLKKMKETIEDIKNLKEKEKTNLTDLTDDELKKVMNDEEIKNFKNKNLPDVTKKSALEMTQQGVDKSMKYLEDNLGITSIFVMMEKNKWRLIILFIIFIYIVFVNILLVYNPGEYITNLKSYFIPIFVLFGFILFMALMISGKTINNNKDLVEYKYIKDETKQLLKDCCLLFLFSIMFMTILYTSTQILYQINVNFNGLTMLALFVDILIIVLFIGLLYAVGIFNKKIMMIKIKVINIIIKFILYCII